MNVISYNIIGKSLLVRSSGERESRIDFAWPVADVLACGNVLVVRIDPDPGSEDNENIFGIDGNAAIVWQVPVRKYIYDDSPYTGIKKAGDHVRLFNWDGTELLVDPSTGEILQATYGR